MTCDAPHLRVVAPAVAADTSGTLRSPALGATGVWAGATLLFVFAGSPGSARSFGEVVGSLLFAALLSALLVWLVVRRGPLFWQLVPLPLPFSGWSACSARGAACTDRPQARAGTDVPA